MPTYASDYILHFLRSHTLMGSIFVAILGPDPVISNQQKKIFNVTI